VKNQDGTAGEDAQEKGADEAPEPKAATAELTADVRQRLKKLDRLEPKYAELLRSYRVAHARVSAIEPFEATLRENTSLTSINDPGALVEYLQQNNLKTNMVMDELKRIYAERDVMKKQLEAAEKRSTDAEAELKKLRGMTSTTEPAKNGSGDDGNDDGDTPVAITEAKGSDDGSEDFFSYESELPRLQDEVKAYEGQVADLREANSTLKVDLASAKESAEQLVRNLENSTKQMASLREEKAKLDSGIKTERQQLQHEITDLSTKLVKAEQDLSVQKSDAEQYLEAVKELEIKLNATAKDLEASKGANLASQNDRSENEALVRKVKALELEFEESRSTQARQEKRSETLSNLVQTLRTQLQQAQAATSVEIKANGINSGEPKAAESAKPDTSASKKKSKKKKKVGKGTDAESSTAAEVEPPTIPVVAQDTSSTSTLELLQKELESLHELCADKDASISRLQSKMKDQETLQEEIESLRDDLVDIGQSHVASKDNIKELQAEKSALQETIAKLETEVAELRGTHDAQTGSGVEFRALQNKAQSLETDLAAAQNLAASRFKDLAELRDILQTAQPELTSLRSEVGMLRKAKDELASKTAEVKNLESRQKELKTELVKVRKQITERDAEIRGLNEKASLASSQKREADESTRKREREFQRAVTGRSEALELKEKITADLSASQSELTASKASAQRLEQQLAKATEDSQSLKDEITLKTAQYASAQSLMNSMQDTTSELSAQMRETKSRCESLEEELADAHRLLSERSREFETMRRLLAEVDGRADARIKMMRQEVETAVEERDRAEEQLSGLGRKRVREVEELKTKVREAERALGKAVQEKEDAESAAKAAARHKDDVEQRARRTAEEVVQVREAMAQLRDALDETEKTARDLEREKSELKRSVEESQARLEKMQKSHRTLPDAAPSSRSSLESSRPVSRLASPPPRAMLGSPAPGGKDGAQKGMDYVYLKNVLLQFLEQRDKKHQMQLVPVLGMLLHFDR
jgi:chromosome segregation ATPase